MRLEKTKKKSTQAMRIFPIAGVLLYALFAENQMTSSAEV